MVLGLLNITEGMDGWSSVELIGSRCIGQTEGRHGGVASNVGDV